MPKALYEGWIVVNTLCVGDWEDLPIYQNIPREDRPSRIHYTREEAENEMLRLKKKIPHGEFMLFEAVSQTVQSEVDPNVFFIEPCQAE